MDIVVQNYIKFYRAYNQEDWDELQHTTKLAYNS